ncbi:MAG: SPFH domain-containing protein [Elusimicrobia bacterium]|nr:SPFH domain-containing protein [Elusimicrobiota bacterium]
MNFVYAFWGTFVGFLIGLPILRGVLRMLGAYVIVEEGTCRVYVLFGKVLGVLDEPGFYCLWTHFGAAGFLVNWFGSCQVLDRRLDQVYLRSQPVNTEEGAPMGVGIWYEMAISEPVSYLFKNADPRGSLSANVSNAAVRCLSNMPLQEMLETRHRMSQMVRDEVSPKSNEWGYRLGSTYIRKVHFRDRGMIQQIEAKVVNRLRQVTSAIKQDGANQVNIITSTADRQAAIAFAQAAAVRPLVVGKALQDIAADPEIVNALFDILETQKLIDGDARILLVPPGNELLWTQLLRGLPAAERPVEGATAHEAVTQSGATVRRTLDFSR